MTKPNILFVCTANICRSPTAEYLARARFGFDKFRFASAGFMRADQECPTDLAKVLEKREIDVSPHRSHTVNQATLAAADLVLTMEAQHVQKIAIKFPESFAKTLPLVEAAERLRGRRLSVAEFVAEIQTRDPLSYLGREWDVDDPYKRGTRRYRKAVDQIDGLVEIVLSALS